LNLPVKKEIVIYEDNAFLRQSIAELIQEDGRFRVTGDFDNCNQVISQLQTLHPRVVLLDIGLPGLSGLEALKAIKSHFPEIDVIMLTVFEDNENIFEAIRAGASGYLLKKTPPQKIPDAIEEVLHGGAPMTSSIARKVLHLFQNNLRPSKELNRLGPREQEVLQLLTSGHSYKMIAQKCQITVETVRTHIKRIYEKLQVHSATEAAAKAFRK
jgi:DNA-binding NarL/FixJ family response regulator